MNPAPLGSDGRDLTSEAACGFGLPLAELCGRPATIHVCPRAADGGEAGWSLYACEAHKETALADPWDAHLVAGDCGHPLAVWIYAHGNQPSRCEVRLDVVLSSASRAEALA